MPQRDYLLGCLQFDFESIEDFSRKLRQYLGIETDPVLDLFVYDISSFEGRFVRVKPNPPKSSKEVLGIEFAVGVFDNRLLREVLEKHSKRSAVIQLNDFNNLKNPPALEQSAAPVFTYLEHRVDEETNYAIRSNDLLPPLNFKLREFVYY